MNYIVAENESQVVRFTDESKFPARLTGWMNTCIYVNVLGSNLGNDVGVRCYGLGSVSPSHMTTSFIHAWHLKCSNS